MRNYVEYNSKISFHSGYYIKECLDANKLSVKEFAKRSYLTL